MISSSQQHENQSPLSKAALERSSWGGGFYAFKGHLATSFHCIAVNQKGFYAMKKLVPSGIVVASAFRQVLLDQCRQVPWWEVQVDACLEAESQHKEFTTIMPSIGSLNQYIKYHWILYCLITIILKFKCHPFQRYIMCSVIIPIDQLKRVVIVLQF